MNVSRTLLAIVLCSIFLIHVAAAGEGSTTEGTFTGIDEGDYAHFLIKDKKGQPDSFIILRPDKSVQPFMDNPVKLKGRRVRVFWKEEMIPEAGAKMKTITRVETPAK